ncbi:hypothetical protein CPB85DRAFT_1431385 [Mucidula mucida]|nr:hypothetical protein CPB85DRAFT_1431385 [Mucidula mucida]
MRVWGKFWSSSESTAATVANSTARGVALDLCLVLPKLVARGGILATITSLLNNIKINQIFHRKMCILRLSIPLILELKRPPPRHPHNAGLIAYFLPFDMPIRIKADDDIGEAKFDFLTYRQFLIEKEAAAEAAQAEEEGVEARTKLNEDSDEDSDDGHNVLHHPANVKELLRELLVKQKQERAKRAKNHARKKATQSQAAAKSIERDLKQPLFSNKTITNTIKSLGILYKVDVQDPDSDPSMVTGWSGLMQLGTSVAEKHLLHIQMCLKEVAKADHT